MKAIGFFKCDSQTGAESLRDIDIPKPSPTGRDLLVKIEAVSINPVDVKTRSRVPADKKDATILGFDGAGVVESVGDQVRNFKPGDECFMPARSYAQVPTRNITLSTSESLGRNPGP